MTDNKFYVYSIVIFVFIAALVLGPSSQSERNRIQNQKNEEIENRKYLPDPVLQQKRLNRIQETIELKVFASQIRLVKKNDFMYGEIFITKKFIASSYKSRIAVLSDPYEYIYDELRYYQPIYRESAFLIRPVLYLKMVDGTQEGVIVGEYDSFTGIEYYY